MSSDGELFLQNLSDGKLYTITSELTIGRSKNASVTINDEKISGMHLKVSKVGNTILIEDLATRNGTSLNDSILIPNQLMQIKQNDIITIGNITLKLVRDDHEEQAPNQKMQDFEVHIGDMDIKNSEKDDLPPRHKVQEFEAYEGDMDLEIDGLISGLLEKSHKLKSLTPNEQLQVEIKEHERLSKRIEEINDKITYKEVVQNKLIEFEEKNKNLTSKMAELKNSYDKSKNDWDEINSKISTYEIELRRLNLRKVELSGVMEKYENYLKVCTEKSRLTLELKTLMRENLETTQKQNTVKIEEKEVLIRTLEKKVLTRERESEKSKEREKQRIKDEIKRLQSKLGES
jgi:pSer/pThr/pTyr-binding forkhead associated (FHA) protein